MQLIVLTVPSLNFAEGYEPGNGLCQKLVQYSTVTMEEQKKLNDSLRKQNEQSTGDYDDGEGDDKMSLDSNAGTGMDNIEDEIMEDASPCKRRRKLHWKTEYLVYCFLRSLQHFNA